MGNLPAVRHHPPDALWSESLEKTVSVTDWDGYITGGLALGDETAEEWLKFEGEPVEVLANR